MPIFEYFLQTHIDNIRILDLAGQTDNIGIVELILLVYYKGERMLEAVSYT